MEKEELLRILIVIGSLIIFMFNHIVKADKSLVDNTFANELLPTIENKVQITEMIEQSRLNVLKQMLEQYNSEQLAVGNDPVPANSTSLRVFVSSSMSEALLQSYIAEAARYRAVIVFSGLINNSWKDTLSLISQVNTTEGSSIIMDDEAFDKYEIAAVPTIILSREPGILDKDNTDHVYDKVVGNIGIRAALAKFAAEGDLSTEASKWLE